MENKIIGYMKISKVQRMSPTGWRDFKLVEGHDNRSKHLYELEVSPKIYNKWWFGLTALSVKTLEYCDVIGSKIGANPTRSDFLHVMLKHNKRPILYQICKFDNFLVHPNLVNKRKLTVFIKGVGDVPFNDLYLCSFNYVFDGTW